MMSIRGLLIGAVAVLGSIALPSCTNTQNEFSSLPCRLLFDNSIHQNTTLSTAMNSASPGIFCTIRKTVKSGAVLLNFSTNYGQESDSKLDEAETKRTLILGQNNGIIVGFGNLSDPITFYAYDRECPNCFVADSYPLKSRPLSVSNTGIATCSVCHREYNLNAGGYIVKGDSGKKLTRYPATTTGALGVLNVN